MKGAATPSRMQGEAVSLPDFRNLGVLLRIILIAEAIKGAVVLAVYGDLSKMLFGVGQSGVIFEPVLLSVVFVLYLAAPRFAKLHYRVGVAAVLLLSALATGVWQTILDIDHTPSARDFLQEAFASALLALSILAYFNWRHRVLSPALAEARLLALQARIRPHFLFNSLNAVLGLIREDPKRAERVLENLSDLFRALLAESGTLVRLEQEIDHARAYAEIEAMRLGDRLTVNWQCQNAPPDALVPPLILQPLLENAVYHGIEPLEAGGVVTVSIFLKGGQVNVVIRNPCRRHSDEQPDGRITIREGNRMALNNIRERLALHFDAEAEMSAFEAGDDYVVQIRLPYKRAEDQPFPGPGGGVEAGWAVGRDEMSGRP